MTDHETNFVGWNDLPGAAPIENYNNLMRPEPFPQIDALASCETIEKPPHYPTSATMQGIIDGQYADPEDEDEEDYYGKETGGDDDEYGDEDGDEEEGGEEEYGEYDEE